MNNVGDDEDEGFRCASSLGSIGRSADDDYDDVAVGAADVEDPNQKTLWVPDSCPDVVNVAFFEHADYTKASAFDALAESHIRLISPRYEHCQLMFEWRATSYSRPDGKAGCPIFATFSTTMRTPSAFTNVRYSHEKWVILTVAAVHGRYVELADRRQLLFKWVTEHKDVPFNTIGHYWNFIPPASCCPSILAYDANGSSYFCAEQVASALRDVGVGSFVHVKPHLFTPDMVYDLLIRDGGVVHSVNAPLRMFYGNATTLMYGTFSRDRGVRSIAKQRSCTAEENRKNGAGGAPTTPRDCVVVNMPPEASDRSHSTRVSCVDIATPFLCCPCRTCTCGAGTMGYGGAYDDGEDDEDRRPPTQMEMSLHSLRQQQHTEYFYTPR